MEASMYLPVVEKCRLYIDEHIYEPLYVHEIANALHVSVSYLSHMYKKETGESISDYIRRRKMEEAKQLLRYTTFPVTCIYEMLSYCSQSYFSDIFRKETGMTPCLFRNSNG